MIQLSKLEARELIRWHWELIHKMKKEKIPHPEEANERFISAHKRRIEELRKYA